MSWSIISLQFLTTHRPLSLLQVSLPSSSRNLGLHSSPYLTRSPTFTSPTVGSRSTATVRNRRKKLESFTFTSLSVSPWLITGRPLSWTCSSASLTGRSTMTSPRLMEPTLCRLLPQLDRQSGPEGRCAGGRQREYTAPRHQPGGETDPRSLTGGPRALLLTSLPVLTHLVSLLHSPVALISLLPVHPPSLLLQS